MRLISKRCFSTSKVLQECFIVAAKRTPIGKQLGQLSRFRAPDLAGFAIQSLIQGVEMDTDNIDQVLMGVTLQANIGQNPARQAALLGGISIQTPATTISKACASGLKSVILGSTSIKVGENNCIVAGGFESMSNVPHYHYQKNEEFLIRFQKQRKGKQLGETKIIDAILQDGIEDKFSEQPLGFIAETLARDSGFSRETIDAVTISSFERALLAQKDGYFKSQLAQIQFYDARGKVFNFSEDNYLSEYDQEKILNDIPFYSKEGVITLSNQSQFGDGAAALILASGQSVKDLGLKPLAKIISFQEIEKEPIDYVSASVEACKILLKKQKIPTNRVDLFEIGEDFSTQVLSHLVHLKLDFDKVNVFGGSLALGNPLGMTGARLVVNLVHGLKKVQGKYGVVAMGNAGGGGQALLIENV